MASPLCVNTVYKEWVFCVFGFFFYVLGFGFWFGVFSGFLGFLSFWGFLLWGFLLWRFFILIFGFVFVFCSCLVLVFCDFLILIVVAYCTQLLSQAMYNLMMAAMAETCSC